MRLAQMVAETEALNADRYTSASWSRLSAAQAQAKAVLANEQADSSELKEAEAKLAAAYKGLERKSSGSTGSTGGASSVNDREDYWNGVKEKIENAAEGDTVNVKLESGEMMPATVVDAAAAGKVKLNVTIGDEEYLVSEYAIDGSAVYYSAAEIEAYVEQLKQKLLQELAENDAIQMN